MINVLIVDDNVERIREITSCISDDSTKIEYATTKNEALNKFSTNQYDLAIIDIMLPNTMEQINPDRTAGIDLIKDLEKRKNIKPPLSILGITSDNETFSTSIDFFNDRLLPILIWNTSNGDSCKNKIINKLNYIKSIKRKCNGHNKLIDIAIITAVEDEFNAVKDCFDNWEPIKMEDDPYTYFVTGIELLSGEKNNILLTLLPEMGLTASSNMTTKIIQEFSPKKIFMVGICGGVKGSVNLGDIIVANTSWDYGCGKIKPKLSSEKGYYCFEASPHQISISPNMADNLKFSTSDIIEKITQKWNIHHVDKPLNPKLHIGPMPSGASVICDTELFNEIIKPQHRKCLGLDMETYGVYYSSQHTTTASIDFLSIKSVSDYADTEKNDDYHKFCCFASASFLKECLINELF